MSTYPNPNPLQSDLLDLCDKRLCEAEALCDAMRGTPQHAAAMHWLAATVELRQAFQRTAEAQLARHPGYLMAHHMAGNAVRRVRSRR